MTPTMRDVAERAGVSAKTVSNVINGYPFIREETRLRVEEALRELNYQMNVSARNLRRGATGVIGLALPELSLPYFAELADAIMDAGHASGLTVVIERTRGDRNGELDALRGPRRHTTDGLLYSPLALGPEDEHLLPSEAPLVLLGERIFSPRFDHVTMQNVEAARAATTYLLSLGRTRIAAIGVHPEEKVGSAALRLEGYRQALSAAGVPDDPGLYGEAQLWHRSTGAEAMAAVLDRGIRPDAIFAFNDTLGLGAMHELQVRGFDIPRDILVIGFDDVEETRYSAPTMTSVNPGREFIAQTAVRLLLDRIGRQSDERSPELIKAPFRIVERMSTAVS